MAQKVTIVLTDDIDGGDADETITFGLDGAKYEIDLSATNAAKLCDALAPYIGAGRKLARGHGGGRGRGGRRGGHDGGTSPAEIRAWAKSNGYSVPERGRIPSDVREAFEAAN
jgi:hypothetical protein